MRSAPRRTSPTRKTGRNVDGLAPAVPDTTAVKLDCQLDLSLRISWRPKSNICFQPCGLANVKGILIFENCCVLSQVCFFREGASSDTSCVWSSGLSWAVCVRPKGRVTKHDQWAAAGLSLDGVSDGLLLEEIIHEIYPYPLGMLSAAIHMHKKMCPHHAASAMHQNTIAILTMTALYVSYRICSVLQRL